jgi:K+/H+ antiporter YhaU regulatory subunit KhtT
LGATVSAVRRRGQRLIAPASTMVLESGDVVVLLGSAAAVTAAEERLLKG